MCARAPRPRLRPVHGGGDRAHHVVGRDRHRPGEHEHFAAAQRLGRGGEQAAAEVVDVDRVVQVLAPAEQGEAAGRDAAEQLEQAPVAGAVGLADPDHDHGRAGLLRDQPALRLELGPAVDVVRTDRRARVDQALARAVHADRAAVDEAPDAGAPRRLEQPLRRVQVDLPEVLVRHVHFVLGRRQVHDRVDPLDQVRRQRLIERQQRDLDPGPLEDLAPGRLGGRVDQAGHPDVVAELPGEAGQARADEAGAAGDEEPHARSPSRSMSMDLSTRTHHILNQINLNGNMGSAADGVGRWLPAGPAP